MAEKNLSKLEEWKKSNPDFVFNNPGNPIEDVYEFTPDKKDIFKTGERNIQEEANAAAVGCGVYGIIDRILRGDEAALPPAFEDGTFADVSGVADTAGEAYQAKLRVDATAANAPKEKADEGKTPDEANDEIKALKDEIDALKAQLKG